MYVFMLDLILTRMFVYVCMYICMYVYVKSVSVCMYVCDTDCNNHGNYNALCIALILQFHGLRWTIWMESPLQGIQAHIVMYVCMYSKYH